MALSYIGHRGGSSDNTALYTNGGAPGAITVHTSTATGDLLVWLVHIRSTGGNESFAWPGGWNEVFQSSTTSGTMGMAWRIRDSGDTTYTLGTLTNVTSGTTGETVTTTIMTWRGHNATTPIGSYTTTLSTWASSASFGPIVAPSTTSLPNGDAVVIWGGKHENTTGSTLTSGESLTWSQVLSGGGQFNTNLGADAGGIVQIGLNESGSAQTLVDKTITATGTNQIGCGRQFVVQAAAITATLVDVIGCGIIPVPR